MIKQKQIVYEVNFTHENNKYSAWRTYSEWGWIVRLLFDANGDEIKWKDADEKLLDKMNDLLGEEEAKALSEYEANR